jgi:hypothetical protein
LKRRRTFVVATVAVVLIAGLVAWRVRDSGDADSSNIAITTTTVIHQPTTVPQATPYAELAADLPESLDGYRVDTGAKATGSLDMKAAIAAEADHQAEQALLETRHYKNGYARAFTNGDNHVYMLAYRFGNANDASLYMTDGMINLYGKGANEYDVADVPGGKGFSRSTTYDGSPAVVHGVTFTKDDRFYLVFTRSAGTTSPTEAAQIAASMYKTATAT